MKNEAAVNSTSALSPLLKLLGTNRIIVDKNIKEAVTIAIIWANNI